jgi:D-alanyl-D-alanine dipeptidase
MDRRSSYRSTVNVLVVTAALLSAISGAWAEQSDLIASRPPDIVDVNIFEPGMVMDIRYYADYNFVGQPINGYNAPKCLLSRRAAKALRTVREAVTPDGYNLKIFDCYRPQRAVDHFIRWAGDLEDTDMKSIFYPFIEKSDLFDKGYIAAKSSHSRASTIDLTLVDSNGHELDMGYPYDFFDPFSHTDNPDVDQPAFNHRQYLKNVMERHGFTNLPEEWWHYTLTDEPYPETYFDFPVE